MHHTQDVPIERFRTTSEYYTATGTALLPFSNGSLSLSTNLEVFGNCKKPMRVATLLPISSTRR